MPANRNEDLIRQYYDEAFNTGDVAQFEHFFAPTFIDHDAFDGQIPGPEGIKAAYTTWRAAFPDTHVTLDDIVAAGEKVVVVTQLHATHLGTFMDIPATRKRLCVRGISVFRIQEGQIVERHGLTDTLGLLRQLRRES